MRRTGSLLAWITLALLAALAAALALHALRFQEHSGASRAGEARLGAPLPDVPLERLDGTPARLAAYRGHPLFINFFATWCPPCKAELPDIERRYAANRGHGLIVLGIDQQESRAAVLAFAKPKGITYPLLIDRGQAAIVYDLAALPTSLFVDAHGVVRAIHVGRLSARQMDEDLAKIL
jgi:peroxiredoxin